MYGRKTFRTTQNYKTDQITMDCIDLTSKQSKMLRYVTKHSKQRKTTKWSNYSALHRFDVKTIRNVQWRRKIFKTAKLQNWSNYNELLLFDVETIKTTQNYKRDQITINLHRFDIKTIQNVEIRRKTFKTTQNYQTDQITMDCIDLTSKQSKMLRYVAKLRKWSNYSALHRFDVKPI